MIKVIQLSAKATVLCPPDWSDEKIEETEWRVENEFVDIQTVLAVKLREELPDAIRIIDPDLVVQVEIEG